MADVASQPSFFIVIVVIPSYRRTPGQPIPWQTYQPIPLEARQSSDRFGTTALRMHAGFMTPK